MNDLYTAATPNGLKIALLLHEGEIAHRAIRMNLSNGAVRASSQEPS